MTTSTFEFQETTFQAPDVLASTNRSSSMVSKDSSDQTDDSGFGSEKEDNNNKMDDASDSEGNE